MGRFKGNDATRGLQGNVGDFFNFRQHLGKTVSTRQVGKRTKPGTDKQKKTVTRFLKATRYAKAVMEIPAKKALYEAKKVPGAGAYQLAVNDYLKLPEIDLIETEGYTGEAGSVIIVHALDDFEIKRVKVIIYSAAGDSLEDGDAILDAENGVDYVYTATVLNSDLPGTRIKAVAYDTPGNQGSLEMIL